MKAYKIHLNTLDCDGVYVIARSTDDAIRHYKEYCEKRGWDVDDGPTEVKYVGEAIAMKPAKSDYED